MPVSRPVNPLLTCLVLFMLVLPVRVIAVAPDSSSTAIPASKSVQDFYALLLGEWQGSYSLWLRPGTPAQESTVTAGVRASANGMYYLMDYNWGRSEQPAAGVFLLGGHEHMATAAWGDSFHMPSEPMQCKGELQAGGRKLTVTGSYAAGDGPDWRWRTEFSLQPGGALLMEAYNIMPDGVEALAVRALLKPRPAD